MSTWPNGQPLAPFRASQAQPPDPPHDDCTDTGTAAVQAILDHLASMAPAELGEHLARTHKVALTWGELDDTGVLRSYHANAHDRQLQEARHHA